MHIKKFDFHIVHQKRNPLFSHNNSKCTQMLARRSALFLQLLIHIRSTEKNDLQKSRDFKTIKKLELQISAKIESSNMIVFEIE